MSIQKGKYFDVKKTKAYFDAMNTEMDKYIANAEITNAEYDAFNASESFKGLTANSVKLLVKNRAGLFLNETVKAQKMVKDAQKYTLTTFASIVDSAPNARIEYDTLRKIETDFKEFYNKFRSISRRVDKLSDDLNREFGYYANFGKPNAPTVINEFNSFCGGESDGVGYLSECINKLVRFDEITHEYITRKEINTHATTISTKAKSVGAALCAPLEKSKQLKDIVVTKISDADVPKTGGATNGKYAALQKQYGFTDEEMEYLNKYYPGLLSSLDGARRYSSSDADKIYKNIKEKLNYCSLRGQYNFTNDELDFLINNHPEMLSTLDGVRKYSTADADKVYANIDKTLVTEYYDTNELLVRGRATGTDGRHVDTTNPDFNDSTWWSQEKCKNINPYAEIGDNEVNRSDTGVLTDKDGRYWVAVGPNVMNPDHTGSQKCSASEMNYGTKVDIVLEDENGNVSYMYCVVGECKAHTYPDGIHQTGDAFPNGTDSHPANADDSVVEFCGNAPEMINGLKVKEIIVYDE